MVVMLKSFAMMSVMLASFGLGSLVSAAPSPDSQLASLHFRSLGPNGNRAISVIGVPGDARVAYYGAASGGIWKTTDGGAHFKPIFDSTDVSAVGAIALAPSNPDIVWAGTGEPSIIRTASSGNGVYKSVDGGSTWEHMGLEQAGHIGNIAVNPQNPDIVYVCALGNAYRSNPERGVYRTEDGGRNWRLVLKVNGTTGCYGLSMDAHDPNTLFAGTWQLSVSTWKLNSGGPDGGIFVTRDGGDTWSQVSGHGLPAKGTPVGKISVRVAPSNSSVVYALIQTKTGLLYRSNNGGRDWSLVHESDELNNRMPYFGNLTVGQDDENLIFIPNQAFLVSLDGGKTVFKAPRPNHSLHFADKLVYPKADTKEISYVGGDIHDVWVDPKNPERILVADDHGGGMSLNGGYSWFTVVLPIAQIYRVHTDSSIPYNVIGNRQDMDGMMVPSRVLFYRANDTMNDLTRAIWAGSWHGYGGCESGDSVFDPTDPDILWTGCYNGDLQRVNLLTGQSRNVAVWPEASFGANPAKVRDRWNWTFPITISPFDHNRVYVGSQYVYETTDAGQHWARKSPDLTSGEHLGDNGGLTVDNLMTFSSGTLSVIEESPVKAGVIWTGSYDGRVNLTQDGGEHWANVTPKGLQEGATINLQASPFDMGTAYVTANRMRMGDNLPYVFKTTDFGKSWTNISGDIPHSRFSYVHVVRQDPVRKGMLYAGTENALYVSWDDGGHWTRLRNNLPPAPVSWLTIQPKFNDLVIGTYGRGIWILDDVTALRSWDSVSRAGTPHLFDPRPAYRFRTVVTAPEVSPNAVTLGENIPYGADLNYYLPAAGTVTITIADSSGKLVRKLDEKGVAGFNRIFWDLRHEPALKPTLLTNPPGKPWVDTPEEGRPLKPWGSPSPDGPLVLPGTFTVSMTVNGTQVGSAPLQVLADPNLPVDPSKMAAGEAMLLRIQGEINDAVRLINSLEHTRKQIGTLVGKLGADKQASKVRAAATALEAKALEIESRLFYIDSIGGEGNFRGPPELYEKLGSLYNELVNTGRYNTGAQQGPTAAQIEVNEMLGQTLASIQQAAETFTNTDVARFNALAKDSHVDVVIQ
jgi:photosystem II stability/assembly factor-like uncharacterized protein